VVSERAWAAAAAISAVPVQLAPWLSRGRFRTNDRTMAAGASVTWTHWSVLFEVTWDKTRRVLAEALASARPQPSIHTDMGVRANAKKNKKNKKNYFFIFYFKIYFFGSCRRLGKREKIYNLQFTIYNFRVSGFGFQSPKSLNSPSSPNSPGFAGEAARRRRFFRPSSLVTHPSSIPLLGALTPKFLSLSLHSL
jgi:hypothetical protein